MSLAVVPVLIVLMYIYIRDRYEKEPIRLLVVGIIAGLVITYPVIYTSLAVSGLAAFLPVQGRLSEAAYSAFAVAAFTETAFKFAALYFLTWRNPNLNEPVDGIVYSVFISLGFAGAENVLYVLHPYLGGMGTAFVRALVSIPAHALFAITTGYYFAMARFEKEKSKQRVNLFKAFAVTWLIHGIYDFMLLSEMFVLLLLFVPFLFWLWHNGLNKIQRHLDISPFKRKI